MAWLAAAAATTGVIAVAANTVLTLRRLPAPEELFARRVIQSTKIYDRTGAVLLFEFHGEERRTVIPLEEVPAAVKNATVAAEDANFWRHGGVDVKGIVRAVVKDIAAGGLYQGGSTITQQLVKNALLGRERTIGRKLTEATYAIALEARLPKDEILELYLNQIPYGSNAYGIEAAAETYFGRRARELTVAQSALLAALPAAPSYYWPYGTHRDKLMARQDWILGRMAELGYLSPDEARRARGETLGLLPITRNIRAPHFVMFIRDHLVEHYGEEEVEAGGLTVRTTLDWRLQEAAERIVAEQAGRNEALIAAHNMALVAADPRSGEILAMVGARDYFDLARDGNFNVATALRQPGSAFKPFVYATAFSKGLEPETVLFDLPTEFNPACTPEGRPRPGSKIQADACYHPGNYDETFRGPVTVRQAMAQSLNVPSVKVLYLAGIEDSIRTAEALGITSLQDRSRFGLSLVLGGADVRLLEMVGAYAAFAADGAWSPPTGILQVADARGEIIEERRDDFRPVIDPDIARMVSDVLSDNEARVPVFQRNSSLYIPGRRVAAKTGTTQDFRDAWTIGYTPSIAVGVWAGNNDNTPMRQKGSGVMAAAPAWRAFMDFALALRPPEELPLPQRREVTKPALKGLWQGGIVVSLDRISQKRATDLTPPELRVDVAYGEPHDPLFWLNRRDLPGPPPEPGDDPQFPNWEAAFQTWLKTSEFVARSIASIPQTWDDIHTPERQPRVSARADRGENGAVSVAIRVETRHAIREVSILAGDEVISSRQRPPPTFTVTFPSGALREVEVRAYDDVGNIGRVTVVLP